MVFTEKRNGERRIALFPAFCKWKLSAFGVRLVGRTRMKVKELNMLHWAAVGFQVVLVLTFMWYVAFDRETPLSAFLIGLAASVVWILYIRHTLQEQRDDERIRAQMSQQHSPMRARVVRPTVDEDPDE
jgi:hypothetical protein